MFAVRKSQRESEDTTKERSNHLFVSVKVEKWTVEQHTMAYLNPAIENLQYYGSSALTWVSARQVLQIHYLTFKMRAKELRDPGLFYFKLSYSCYRDGFFSFNNFDHVYGPMNLMQDK